MRFAFLAAAVLALPTSAQAATIIQIKNSTVFLGFERFDPTLGHLDSATFDITVNSKRSYYTITNQPAGATFPAQIGWVIDGFVRIDLPIAGQGYQTSLVPTHGSGSELAQFNAFFNTSAQGAATFNIDTSLVLFDPVTNYGPLSWRPYDDGLVDASLDTTFTMNPVLNFYSGLSCESGGRRGAEDCVQARMTLTYNYTPVPEPATWAMMLMGFGLAGTAMRRRSLGYLVAA